MDNQGVVIMGAFEEERNKLIKFFKRGRSMSLIIRGDPGVGKKTLVKIAVRACGHVKHIRINPVEFNTDLSVLRQIATELGVRVSNTNTDENLLDRIRQKIDTSQSLIVLELSCLEKYSIGNQRLLYLLSELALCPRNYILICLAYNIDCLEDLEKRVRSRLNSTFIDLHLPYVTRKDIHRFVRSLNNGQALTPEMEKSLDNMILYGHDLSITRLKEFLFSYQSIDGFELDSENSQNRYSIDYEEKTDVDTSFLLGLTKTQFELTDLAACLSSSKQVDIGDKKHRFDLMEIQKFSNRYNQVFTVDRHTLRECSYLIERGIFSQVNPKENLTPRTKLILCFLFGDYNKAVADLPHLQTLYNKSDQLWKKHFYVR